MKKNLLKLLTLVLALVMVVTVFAGCKKADEASAPHGTKAFASAIPPKLTSCDVHSLLRTIMRTPRITGGFPSDPTWENFPFKPPSEGHSHRCAPLRSHHPKLSWDALCCATLLPHRFVV